MKSAIDKLLQLQANVSQQSAPSMLVDVANFIQHDLNPILETMQDVQNFIAELERENIELRRELLAKQLEGRMTA
ncbi:hypothetical protein [Paenibacillus taiwanensis]|uniref:hypothetical protein n=1 Tax=Paenibacillus taiwanensis TaxID=401638 RepID=UPI00040D4EB0|nr:hypothetical protein [Paenibacillus taiwanensis]